MKDNVVIVNEKEFNRKVEQIKKGGLDNLHIIADFDKTLTTAKVNGKDFKSVIALLREDDYLDKDYIEKAHALYDKYSPFENDHTLSVKEKIKKMEAWWQEHLDLHIEKGLTKNVVDKLCRDTKYKMKFRDSIDKFINVLKDNGVPLLVFSAGIGDVIQYFFESKGLLHKDISIISNFYNYDASGRITGYKGKIIHSDNKGEIAVAKDKHFSKIKDRKNVILLGDSLGDTTMADGLEHKVVLKIGFLDDGSKLEAYKKVYDVLILNDGSLEFVVDIIKKIE
ncbi:MAG: haloacid dehalogenase-like hydrolase [Candidatus ainarchaeum sp.]|nr:haloacid dehalogenase-like hydrolase [Candidatus ainarchaeum sp.]